MTVRAHTEVLCAALCQDRLHTGFLVPGLAQKCNAAQQMQSFIVIYVLLLTIKWKNKYLLTGDSQYRYPAMHYCTPSKDTKGLCGLEGDGLQRRPSVQMHKERVRGRCHCRKENWTHTLLHTHVCLEGTGRQDGKEGSSPLHPRFPFCGPETSNSSKENSP